MTNTDNADQTPADRTAADRTAVVPILVYEDIEAGHDDLVATFGFTSGGSTATTTAPSCTARSAWVTRPSGCTG